MHRPAARGRQAPGVLRLGYFGRLDPAKGLDTLIEALRRIPEAPVRLDIFAVRQAGSEPYASRLERRAAGDRRIVFRAALPPDAVREAMRGCDIVAVPSRTLETGPLVVLEAFDAGTPVLGVAAWRHRGTRHGRDGRDPRASREAGGLGRGDPRSRELPRRGRAIARPASARRVQSRRSRARWRKFTARSGLP